MSRSSSATRMCIPRRHYHTRAHSPLYVVPAFRRTTTRPAEAGRYVLGKETTLGDAEQRQRPVGDRRDRRGRGNRQHPRPDDPPGDAPAYRRQPPYGADPDDSAGDRMSRADRDAEAARGEQRDRARRLGREPAKRLELGDPAAHRMDDAPAA